MADEPKPAPDDNVLSLVGRLKTVAGDLKPLLTLTPAPRCYPHRFQIDGKARTVVCKDCQRSFDPFDALTHIAQLWPDFAGNKRLLSHELERMREKIEAARKELGNVRASVKRWRAKEGGA